jgi:hypothetical protein
MRKSGYETSQICINKRNWHNNLVVSLQGDLRLWAQCVDTITQPPSLLHNVYRVSLPGVKRPGRGLHQSPQSRADVKERVELYLYSAFGPSRPLLGWTFTYLNIVCVCVCERERERERTACNKLRMVPVTDSSVRGNEVSTVIKDGEYPDRLLDLHQWISNTCLSSKEQRHKCAGEAQRR